MNMINNNVCRYTLTAASKLCIFHEQLHMSKLCSCFQYNLCKFALVSCCIVHFCKIKQLQVTQSLDNHEVDFNMLIQMVFKIQFLCGQIQYINTILTWTSESPAVGVVRSIQVCILQNFKRCGEGTQLHIYSDLYCFTKGYYAVTASI